MRWISMWLELVSDLYLMRIILKKDRTKSRNEIKWIYSKIVKFTLCLREAKSGQTIANTGISCRHNIAVIQKQSRWESPRAENPRLTKSVYKSTTGNVPENDDF